MKIGLLVPAFSLTLSACGPGLVDGEFPIRGAFNFAKLGGYFVSDAGGNERFIVYREIGRPAKIVIDARVDSYLVDERLLVVARRPAESVSRDGITDVEMLPICEFWAIDLDSHHVQRIPPDDNRWPSIRCL